VILNVGKYAPQLKMGFTIMSILSVGKFAMIFVMKWFVDRGGKRDAAAETAIGGGGAKLGMIPSPLLWKNRTHEAGRTGSRWRGSTILLQILEVQDISELFPNYHVITKESTGNSCL
jgi:hypothetical protein